MLLQLFMDIHRVAKYLSHLTQKMREVRHAVICFLVSAFMTVNKRLFHGQFSVTVSYFLWVIFLFKTARKCSADVTIEKIHLLDMLYSGLTYSINNRP